MNHIGYLIANTIKSSAEEKAGWVFLAHQKIFKASKLSLLSLPDSLNQFDMLWWHYDSSIFLPKTATDASVVTSIKKYIEKGGALFLSLLGAQFVVDLGVELIKPNYIKKGRWDQTCWVDGNPDIRGFSSFKGHPIFADLQGGVYTWNPKVGQSYSAAIYQAPVVPEKGQVIAVGRSYIRLNENWRLVLEYKLGKGKILTAGSFLFFNDQDNRFRLHLEKFTRNCFEYLLNGGSATAKSYWQFESPQVYSAPHSSKPLQLQQQPWKTTESTLKFESTEATDNFFDLGGRRILIMGRERAGISEVWCHPLRILRNLKLGFNINGSQIQWSDTLIPAITIRPESITRAFRIDDIQIEEIIFTALSAPCGAMHYKIQSNVEVELIITANIDLRFMWPYSPRCTGSLLYSWDQGLRAIVAKNQRGDFVSIFGSGQTPDEYIIGQFADMVEKDNHFVGRKNKRNEIGFGLRFKLNKKNAQLTVVFSGSHRGEKEALRAYRSLLKNSVKVYNEQVSYFQRLLSESTQIVSADAEFNAGYQWAVVATDRFFTETPPLGWSFMAGYGTTESGWDGGQSVSGRPGYAWYFARDSVWTSFAVLDYGDFEKVRDVLAFLGRHQDITGKILHECTTSVQVHYDAADATPLYVILMGRYLKASGDIEFVKDEFPRVLKAMEFCFSTDTDQDHLIENSHAGHGWVEGGKLFPVHCELYLAACWGAALQEAAYLATLIGKAKLSDLWLQESKKVKEVIQQEFWNPETKFYNFGKYENNTCNTEKTILPTVAIYFGLTKPEHAENCLNEYAADNFATDWGIRLVGKDNPMYHPAGYHYGSVWPLFTGWTSLAEYKLQRPTQGLIHLMNNLSIYQHGARGYVTEVLHGHTYQPIGVCPHQAWSESMVLLPVLEGMLGLYCDALKNRVQLKPAFPPHWKFVNVNNIRAGSRRFDLKMRRTPHETLYIFQTNNSNALRIVFQPTFALGSKISEIWCGKKRVAQNIFISKFSDFPVLDISLLEEVKIFVRHTGGIALVPPLPRLRTGETSCGIRILDEKWQNGNYILTMEGRAGQAYHLQFVNPDQSIGSVQNAIIEKQDEIGAKLLIRFESSNVFYIKKKIVLSIN